MPYNEQLADRVRTYLSCFPELHITEKKMFGGLAFLVNGKMCVNVSDENLMCRFDPALENELAEKEGYLPMIMRGKQLKSYCYIDGNVIKTSGQLHYWIDICLDFNDKAEKATK